jgi:hypothetical protein
VNVNGLVTQVAFYAAQSCNDNQIYFGAFSALSAMPTSPAEFNLTASSDALSLNRTSDSDTSMKLVTISLCINSSTPAGCQGQAFTINNGQYFGSYSVQCIMGFAPTPPAVYPSTYYQQSSNPFANGAQTDAFYTNGYTNVVLQYITIQLTNQTGQNDFLRLISISFIIFRFMQYHDSSFFMNHLTTCKYVQCKQKFIFLLLNFILLLFFVTKIFSFVR